MMKRLLGLMSPKSYTALYSYKPEHSVRDLVKETQLFARKKLYQNLLFIFVLFLPLAGCDTPNLENSLPELTFKHQSVIHLDVESIQIINEFKMPFKSPNVEHLVPVSPGASA